MENRKFKIQIDFSRNLIFIEKLVNTPISVNIELKSDDIFSYKWESKFIFKNHRFWYGTNINILELNNIHIYIYNNDYVQHEFFKNRNKIGGLIKPVLLNIHNRVGLGDAIAITPTIRKLSKIYNQKISIRGYKEYFEFYKNNPYVNWYYDNNDQPMPDDSENLSCYEIFHIMYGSNPTRVYYTEFKRLVAFEVGIGIKEDELFYDYIPEDFDKIDLPEKYVCINPAIRGIDRNFKNKKEDWQKLVYMLNDLGYYVVSIGKESYYKLDIKLGIDLTGKDCQKNLSQTWHIINNSIGFISFDCGVYIFAGSTNTHLFEIGWMGDPYYHQAVRNGSRYYRYTYIKGECDTLCLFDYSFDVDEHSTVTNRRPTQVCLLNKEFVCIPTPDKVAYIVDQEIKNKYLQN